DLNTGPRDATIAQNAQHPAAGTRCHPRTRVSAAMCAEIESRPPASTSFVTAGPNCRVTTLVASGSLVPVAASPATPPGPYLTERATVAAGAGGGTIAPTPAPGTLSAPLRAA